MRDVDEIPSSERDTMRWRPVKVDLSPPDPLPFPWSRGEIAMGVVAVVCVIVAGIVVITGILPLVGV